MKNKDFNPEELVKKKNDKSIEISSNHLVLKIVIFTIALLGIGVAIVLFILGMNKNVEGWTDVDATYISYSSSANEISLYSYASSTKSYRTEQKLYCNALDSCYLDLYDTDDTYSTTNNIYTINNNPNQEIEVSTFLYNALSTLKDMDAIYLAPIIKDYDYLFALYNDQATAKLYYEDIINSSEKYKTIISYASNRDNISISLLGDNKVKLNVSSEYLEYAKTNEITNFIDLTYYKNALTIDYIADILLKEGYHRSVLTSAEGYARVLSLQDDEFTYSFLDKSYKTSAQFKYTGARSFILLSNFPEPIFVMSLYKFYKVDSNSNLTYYLDTTSGYSKTASNALLAYKYGNYSITEILKSVINIYIQDSIDNTKLNELKDSNIYAMYLGDNKVYYNDDNMNFTYFYSSDELTYSGEKI